MVLNDVIQHFYGGAGIKYPPDAGLGPLILVHTVPVEVTNGALSGTSCSGNQSRTRVFY